MNGESQKSFWQKQETRPVRPFRSAKEFLDGVGFRLYADQEFGTDDALRIERIDFDRLAPAVRLPATPVSALSAAGLPLDALRLVMTVEDRVFKNSFVVANLAVPELRGADVLEVDRDELANMTWSGDTRVHVAVVLAEDRQGGKLDTARRAGAWVARRSFGVTDKIHDSSTFSINAVPPEYFEERGLPRETTYFVEILDTNLDQTGEDMNNLVRVNMTKSLHDTVAFNEDSPAARALEATVYVDVAATVLVVGYASLEKGAVATPGGLLHMVTENLVKATGFDAARLAKWARDNGGAQLRAAVQNSVELTRVFTAAVARRAA